MQCIMLGCGYAGEVTLTGRVLPIGGVKEKALAARRSGVSTLIFPAGNRKDWDELAGAAPVTQPAELYLHDLFSMTLHTFNLMLSVD
jgi:ATP-dependent Lon protease